MQVVWISGPAGVGKSTTAWELYGQYEAAGVRAGYVDIDPSEVLAQVMKKSLASEAVLDRAAIDDFSLPTSGRTVAQIAQSVLDLTGLLPPGG